MENHTVGYQDIKRGLSELSLPENPVILAHSSLKSFGKVEGGAQTLIRALLDACGSGGTLVMPTLSFSGLNEEKPFFDAANTPSDTGYVTEVFRKMPGVLRSRHVCSSAAAFGKDAAYLTQSYSETPCGPESPYRKLIGLGGYCLFFGVDFECNTLFHCAEEEINPAYLRYKTFPDAEIKDQNGNLSVFRFKRYDCYQTGIIRRLSRMEQVFRERGVLRTTKIGKSSVTAISARDNFRICCEVLRNTPEFILE